MEADAYHCKTSIRASKEMVALLRYSHMDSSHVQTYPLYVLWLWLKTDRNLVSSPVLTLTLASWVLVDGSEHSQDTLQGDFSPRY